MSILVDEPKRLGYSLFMATAHIAAVEIVEGIAYELHHNGRVRVVDVDSGEVVSLIFYPSLEAGAKVYAATVATAKKLAA